MSEGLYFGPLADGNYHKVEVLATYTLQLIGPRDPDPHVGYGFPHSVLRETEENLTDLLPAGYSVRIREWDDEEEKPA